MRRFNSETFDHRQPLADIMSSQQNFPPTATSTNTGSTRTVRPQSQNVPQNKWFQTGAGATNNNKPMINPNHDNASSLPLHHYGNNSKQWRKKPQNNNYIPSSSHHNTQTHTHKNTHQRIRHQKKLVRQAEKYKNKTEKGQYYGSQNQRINSGGNSFHNVQHERNIHQRELNRLNDPTRETELSNGLQSCLSELGVFENLDGAKKRLLVLRNLEDVLLEWSKEIYTKIAATTDDVPPNDNLDKKYKLQLISFGSYRLGVHQPDADLDLLALCPPHLKRNDFFTTLVEKLKNDGRVTGLHPIPGAYTPVLKFCMNTVPIDLLFVRLADGSKLLHKNSEEGTCTSESNHADWNLQTSLEPRHEFELDDTMMIGLDEASVRSLNGVRVVQLLLNIVPNKTNFRLVLRAVKQWANVHGLYSNVLGFLGGINWALLVAWICKRNAHASPPVLLKSFFQTFARWRWPKPVTLGPILKQPPHGGKFGKCC